MKNIILYFIVIFITSCGYPDIDSVPDFKEVQLTKEESIDLCNLINTDIEGLSDCLNAIGIEGN